MSSRSNTKQTFDRFSSILQASGVREALAFLVGLSDYRFIGIFRFQGGKATAAVHYDKADPTALRCAEVPETATYCCFIRDSGGGFTTADALADERLRDHVAREAVQAYCGVPVMDAEGQMLGTLCHYDVVPRDPEQLDLQLLLQVASALAYGNHVPPYPAAV
jgi:GAF domain-containing protein